MDRFMLQEGRLQPLSLPFSVVTVETFLTEEIWVQADSNAFFLVNDNNNKKGHLRSECEPQVFRGWVS